MCVRTSRSVDLKVLQKELDEQENRMQNKKQICSPNCPCCQQNKMLKTQLRRVLQINHALTGAMAANAREDA